MYVMLLKIGVTVATGIWRRGLLIRIIIAYRRVVTQLTGADSLPE